MKDPLEWAKGGDDWTLGEWNGPTLRLEQVTTSGVTHLFSLLEKNPMICTITLKRSYL